MTDQKNRAEVANATEEGVRLSKRVAEILKCSRSEAEQVIVGGWVKVNDPVSYTHLTLPTTSRV